MSSPVYVLGPGNQTITALSINDEFLISYIFCKD